MNKVRSLHTAAALAIAALMTTCLIGGTFAKYVTAAEGTKTARVASWGFNSPATLDLSDLFKSSYTNVKSSDTNQAVIAPGTSGSVSFSFPYDESISPAPEVNYSFTVDVQNDSDDAVLTNKDIQYALDNGSWTTWDNVEAALLALSGDASGTKNYEAGTLPEAFTAKDDTHVLYWQWVYTKEVSGSTASADSSDTSAGNSSDPVEVSISISISASQID